MSQGGQATATNTMSDAPGGSHAGDQPALQQQDLAAHKQPAHKQPAHTQAGHTQASHTQAAIGGVARDGMLEEIMGPQQKEATADAESPTQDQLGVSFDVLPQVWLPYDLCQLPYVLRLQANTGPCRGHSRLSLGFDAVSLLLCMLSFLLIRQLFRCPCWVTYIDLAG